MKLRDLERDIREYLEEGLAQIIIYKENNVSWKYVTFCAEWDDNGAYIVDSGDIEDIEKVLQIDENAIIINGYNDRLDTDTVRNRLVKIAYLYESKCGLLKSFKFINSDEEITDKVIEATAVADALNVAMEQAEITEKSIFAKLDTTIAKVLELDISKFRKSAALTAIHLGIEESAELTGNQKAKLHDMIMIGLLAIADGRKSEEP